MTRKEKLKKLRAKSSKRNPQGKRWYFGIDPNICQHDNVQDFTECCLDCGYNTYGYGWKEGWE